MRVLISVFHGICFITIAALGACGGDVTSSSGAGGSGSTSSAAQTSTGTGNPTGGSIQDCLDFCHKQETNGCPTPQGDCTSYCDSIFEEGGDQCADKLGAVFACWLPTVASCLNDPPAECKSQMDAFEACKDQFGCTPGECMAASGPNGAESCGCEETCAMKEYRTDCKVEGGATQCDCFVDGASVGTCQGGATLECDVKGSCCQEQYFKL